MSKILPDPFEHFEAGLDGTFVMFVPKHRPRADIIACFHTKKQAQKVAKQLNELIGVKN